MGIFIENYLRNDLTSTEANILLSLDNKPEIIENNLTDLAQVLHCSGTSIIRLCQKLGFTGFSEFKYESQRLLKLGQSTNEISFLAELNNYIKYLSSDLMQNKIVDFANKIHDAKYIYIAGVEASKFLSEYFCHKLNQIDYAAVHVSDDTLLDLLPNLLSRQSVVIYISISGQTKRLINSARKANMTGATVLSITNAQSSPLSILSKINISARTNTSSYHNYDVTPRTFQTAIIDMIFERLIKSRK
ncbi:MurR/RpiR family transcriptional regulator [Lactococcus fujiensis]|uniref:Transcriptional regulator n=1 Tax=Lactococcus fujiensis JCM 16395 TaxID=1291764 RepID=A0A2A5RI10_9LACT|nr:MurR/RpiR family transcriptional regulator [Lactococcus fujiensis]PCR98739.1 hypothetical protein RT41_GL000933 [Lactococcus fujiensis JCM 16395]